MKILVSHDEEKIYIDEEEYKILAKNGQYLAYLTPGRSIYKNGGSQYEPTIITFCSYLLLDSPGYIQLEVLLVSPVRR